MNISVLPVRLVFNVDSLNAVAVASNWLYLTGGPATVVRINLDSPSKVQDIPLPGKHASSGDSIKHLFADSTGRSLLAVTARKEHFFYSEAKREFKHLAKLRGTTTTCASFLNPHWFLMGTEAGNIVEVGVDSSANETYFKRELKLATQVWKSPSRDAVTGIFVSPHNVIVSCGFEVLEWRPVSSSLNVSELGDSVFRDLFATDAHQLFVSNDRPIKQLVRSPDKKTLAAVVGTHKLAFSRAAGSWHEIEIASSVKHAIVSNYYLFAVTHDKTAEPEAATSLVATNLFTQQKVEAVPVSTPESLRGVSVDAVFGTFWLFSASDLYEVKIANEEAGIWKVLADTARFEEALQITNSRGARSYILEKYGYHELDVGEIEHGAKLLGMSDTPLEIAALKVMQHGGAEAMATLVAARLSITKSKAQQIMLTSWLAQLGDYSFLEKSQVSWDASTVLQILKEQGDSEKYLGVAINIGDIKSAIAYRIAHEQWAEALALLRQYEPAELVYEHASVLLSKAPKPTVESWMRMSNLDVTRLLPSLITYSTEYRGPLEANQAVRYLKHLFRSGTARPGRGDTEPVPVRSTAVYNALVAMLTMHASDKEVLEFLKDVAPRFAEHEFALRMCLNKHDFESAVFLYTHMGLYEDAVKVCLDIGTPQMCETAIEIASKSTTADTQGNEELRKYLLRQIAQTVIKSQGAHAAIQFIRLLRVDDLLSQFPDFDSLSDLAPEIVKSLEQTNNKLSSLSLEIDETLDSSEQMQRELAGFKRRSVLVEPGEPCFVCEFPLVTRKFVVFPCQHGFHADCAQRKLAELGITHKAVTDECVLCSTENILQVDAPLTAEF